MDLMLHDIGILDPIQQLQLLLLQSLLLFILFLDDFLLNRDIFIFFLAHLNQLLLLSMMLSDNLNLALILHFKFANL
jgi:hypothetical protein